jgi:hypothetical protein
VAEGGWVKVATNVVSGWIHKMEKRASYLQTYRLTGEVAPINEDEGVKMFLDFADKEQIKSSVPIDVYVWSRGHDGKLRVDV